MSQPRRLILDTDTGSDDVWGIIEALRAREIVRLEAVTVVCGNFPLELCVKNALLACEAAETYYPPVYRGMERPLLSRRLFQADDAHGSDGLGEMHLPAPAGEAAEGFAPDVIARLVMENPGRIEIATIGPLTNIAMALLREPHLAENIRRLWVLGGTAGARGNLTEAAEYNVGTDPEAAAIVLESGVNAVWVTWDTARGDTEITPAERRRMESGQGPARFCARCTDTLRAYYHRLYGTDSYGVIDSVLVTACLFPEIMEDVFPARGRVELTAGERRGHLHLEPCGEGESPLRICRRVDAAAYKRHLFSLLGA